MMNASQIAIDILCSSLQIDKATHTFDQSTQLLGSLPELDSLSVVTIIAALEDELGVMVDDDEISAEVFETVGSLANFIEAKL